ncbi:hypothetical protein [Flagellimonas beolgyonensis]|uniref:hypothetical protein n=1 Tax=Flagellimonas beolgyonensis TaxID=864064 RepID=UPI000F8DDAD0|nr:hypothetical protein [Allomuricauda beolgyonensis]
MAEQPVNQNTSDEIDLGQLFQLIGKGFNKLGIFFLRVFLYLKKNAVTLAALVILGGAIGYGLKFISTDKMQIDVIVRPNLESKDYLYDVISEIESNIKAKNESFFGEMGISLEEIKGFEVSIEPVNKDMEKAAEKQLEYLEILQKFQNTDLVSDVLREELLKNTELNHRISFKFKETSGGNVAKKLIDYINSNNYFKELLAVHTENSVARIKQNEVLIAQIDTIIKGYSEKLSKPENTLDSGRLVLQNEESLNVAGLLSFKSRLIEDIETRKMELKELTSPIGVINFGKPHQVKKTFFGKKIILIPIVLVSLFFLISILRYLNKKAAELEV